MGAGVGASAGVPRAAGNRTRKIAPSPGRVSTVISPPSERTMPSEIGSPRPVPIPRGLVVKNDSKIRGSTSERDPRTVVGDLDHHVFTLVITANADQVALGIAFRERLGGIEHEVQEHLAEPGRARQHGPSGPELPFQPCPVFQLVAQHGERRFDGQVDVDRHRRVLVRVRKRSQVANDAVDAGHPLLGFLKDRGRFEQHVGEPQPSGHPLRQVAHPLLQEAHVTGERLDVGEDERSRVVDFVGYPRRQEADGGELLGLAAARALAPARRWNRERTARPRGPTADRPAPRTRGPHRTSRDRPWRCRRAPPGPRPRAPSATVRPTGALRWRWRPRALHSGRPGKRHRRKPRTRREGRLRRPARSATFSSVAGVSNTSSTPSSARRASRVSAPSVLSTRTISHPDLAMAVRAAERPPVPSSTRRMRVIGFFVRLLGLGGPRSDCFRPLWTGPGADSPGR